MKKLLFGLNILISAWACAQTATIKTVHKKDGSVYEGGISTIDSISYVFDAAINTALNYGTMNDVDGNNYRTIQIGNQIWMAENLRVTRFRDGSQIPRINDTAQWRTTTSPAMAIYEDDIANNFLHGSLYNWYAVTSAANLCPRGWHAPSDAEWAILLNFLDSKSNGGDSVNIAGSKMKIAGNVYWDPPNANASNSSGFSANAGGARFPSGSYGAIRTFGLWWSSVERDAATAWVRQLSYNFESAARVSYNKNFGFSVRCVKD